MWEPVDIRSNDLAITIRVAINRSRGCIERPPLLSRRGYCGGIGPVDPISGASEDDALGAIEALLSSAPFCIPCLVARTGLRAWDVEIAMRALIRTSDVELAGVCESCRTRPAFRARHRGRIGS